MKQLALCLMGGVLLAGCASPAPIRFHTLDAARVDAAAPVGREASVGRGWPAASGLPAARFDVVVTVPERLNRDNIVLTRRSSAAADTSLQVLEGERWAAVFGDALRDALTVQLARQVPVLPATAVDDEPVHGRAQETDRAAAPVALLRRPLVAASATPTAERRAGWQRGPVPMRLDVQVYRFDGGADGSLDVLLDWRLRRPGARRGDAAAGGEDDARSRSLECRHVFAQQGLGSRVDDVVAAMQQQVAQLAADVVASSQAWLETGRLGCRHALPGAAGDAGRPGAVIGH